MKQYEKILKYLIDVDNSQRPELVSYREIADKFKISINTVDQIVTYLKNKLLIEITATYGGLEGFNVWITDPGKTYFLDLREEKSLTRRIFIRDIAVSIISVAVGFVLGKIF